MLIVVGSPVAWSITEAYATTPLPEFTVTFAYPESIPPPAWNGWSYW